MSINKLVSIKNPIIDAIALLGLDHHQDMPWFTRLATMAEKEINSYYQYKKKIAVLPIVNCSAKLPADARYVQRAILGDLGCDCADLFKNVCSQISLSSSVINASAATNTFLVVDMGTGYSTITGSIPHTIQDNKIILNNNYDGQSLTIQYLAYQTDEEGFLMIGENHVNAIKWNIVWHYWYRKRTKNSLDYGQMNIAFEQWHRECANARAKDSELTESDRDEINYMLHDPFVGMGMDLNVNTISW
jgi:hypothetical protein